MALVSYALVSLEDVKEALGITDNTKDSILTNYINRATDAIEKYCSRRFAFDTYTNQEYDGTGTNRINLKNYPIISLTSLEERTSGFSNTSWETIDADFYKDLDNEGQVYFTGGFTRGVRNYRVTYSAGYTTIPNDLQQACITLVSFFDNQTRSSGMKSETLGEYSYTKEDDINATIKNLGLDEILNFYRNPVV